MWCSARRAIHVYHVSGGASVGRASTWILMPGGSVYGCNAGRATLVLVLVTLRCSTGRATQVAYGRCKYMACLHKRVACCLN